MNQPILSIPREVVTDANLWLNVVLSDHPSHLIATQLVADCLSSGIKMLAPAWWEAEADSALRGMVRGGVLTAELASEAQEILDAAPVVVVYNPAIRAIARKVADAAKRHDVYDSTFTALASVQRCTFWTADKRFFNAIHNEGKGAYPVRLVDTYAGEYAPLCEQSS